MRKKCDFRVQNDAANIDSGRGKLTSVSTASELTKFMKNYTQIPAKFFFHIVKSFNRLCFEYNFRHTLKLRPIAKDLPELT